MTLASKNHPYHGREEAWTKQIEACRAKGNWVALMRKDRVQMRRKAIQESGAARSQTMLAAMVASAEGRL